MKEPLLFKTIDEYDPKARFHMPSHNGKNISPLYASAKYDITELSFSDNLQAPCGVIADAEKKMARAVGAERTLFFTAGATSAIFTAILTASYYVDDFCVMGTVHSSVINALEVLKLNYYKEPKKQGKQALILTSPDYYGVVADIENLKKLYPEALLIVDEAHGAHFPYSSLLPQSAVKYADMAVQSMHKTMPVYTGGALLNVKEEYYLKAVESRRKLHTSSPSYLIMASMDKARADFEENGERYYLEIKEKISALRLPNGFSVVKNDDFSRLVIAVPDHTTGYAVANAAQEKGIYFEMADSKRLVAIVTPFNVDELGYLQTLEAPTPKKISLASLLGTTAKNDLILYPPGAVLVKKGEIIDETTLKVLEKEKDRIIGLWT